MAKYAFAIGLVFLSGCLPANVGTNPRDTGGGGISWYENHPSRKPGAVGTGSSAAAQGHGPVSDSGAGDAPGNAGSPADSNGGQADKVNPNALL